MEEEEKVIIRAALNGKSYQVISKAYRVNTGKISSLVSDFIANTAPEIYANISADGKITIKELRDHGLYLISLLDQEGV